MKQYASMKIETYYVPIRIRALKYASVYRLNTGNHSYMIDSGMDRTAMEFRFTESQETGKKCYPYRMIFRGF